MNKNSDVLNSKFCEELGRALRNSLPKILDTIGKERVKRMYYKMRYRDIHTWYELYFR